MSGLEEACAAIREAVEASRPERGGAPRATALHFLMILEALRDASPLGRPRLAAMLGVGEASTRTLLSRMEQRGLILHTHRGYTITARGLEALSKLTSLVRGPFRVLIEGVGDSYLFYVEGLDPPRDLTSVYYVRDYIVMEGCRTVIVGGCEGGEPVFPGLEVGLEDVREACLGQGRALVVIVPRGCEGPAYTGILRFLAENHCPG